MAKIVEAVETQEEKGKILLPQLPLPFKKPKL